MITEDYVSFEIARLLKEKGFDENTPVNYFVGDDKPRGCRVGEMIYHKRLEEDTHLIACPTLQMAMKWLRDVHKIYMYVAHDSMENTWFARVYNDYKTLSDVDNQPTYEEAAEAAIKYCLENMI